MADNKIITIEKTVSGKYRAVLQHGTVKISCGNESSDVVEDKARNIILLVAEAVDLTWFRDDAYDLYVLGPVHDTTGGHSDPKHLTVTVKPGGKAQHLYLNPDNKETTVLDTDKLDYKRPPRSK